jgi:hypothetical protein
MALSDLLDQEDSRYISIADLIDEVMQADKRLKNQREAATALLKMFDKNKIRRLPTLFTMAKHKLWEEAERNENYGYSGWSEEEHFLGILRDVAAGKTAPPVASTPIKTYSDADLDDDLPF